MTNNNRKKGRKEGRKEARKEGRKEARKEGRKEGRMKKERKEKKDCIKIQNFCASRDTIKKVKVLPTGWERIFTNCMSDKGLVSRIYKQNSCN